MVANDRRISATSTNEVPLKPQTGKMLCSPVGARNRNNPEQMCGLCCGANLAAMKRGIADCAS
jgi:hypothetical protein